MYHSFASVHRYLFGAACGAVALLGGRRTLFLVEPATLVLWLAASASVVHAWHIRCVCPRGLRARPVSGVAALWWCYA